jgi:hypothetical protein
MPDELKLCKCGGMPKIGIYERKYEVFDMSGESIAYYIECQTCKTSTMGSYSKIQSINEWNDMND